jgi:hypothetical protein
MATTPIAGDRKLVPVAEPLFSGGERAALGLSGSVQRADPLSIVDGAIHLTNAERFRVRVHDHGLPAADSRRQQASSTRRFRHRS